MQSIEFDLLWNKLLLQKDLRSIEKKFFFVKNYFFERLNIYVLEKSQSCILVRMGWAFTQALFDFTTWASLPVSAFSDTSKETAT